MGLHPPYSSDVAPCDLWLFHKSEWLLNLCSSWNTAVLENNLVKIVFIYVCLHFLFCNGFPFADFLLMIFFKDFCILIFLLLEFFTYKGSLLTFSVVATVSLVCYILLLYLKMKFYMYIKQNALIIFFFIFFYFYLDRTSSSRDQVNMYLYFIPGFLYFPFLNSDFKIIFSLFWYTETLLS